MYQNYHQNLGTSGHRASSSYNYLSNYNNNYHTHSKSINESLPPTSSHYLPPPSASFQAQQQVQAYQPTMVGIVPPPHIHSQPQPQYHQYPPAPIPAPAPIYTQAQVHAHQQAVLQAQQQQAQQAQQQQQQATTGGINSVLEYDLSNMSTFLSWCGFGMLKQNRNPSKEFENLINSVLFATRLPKSTIIISLEYMNQRFSNQKFGELSESEIFIKLIVSLILGNKFNDDNTFTNRSWCGATGLQIEILNKEEKDWLQEVNWQLNVVSFENNIITLEECWKTWLEKYSNTNSPNSITNNTPNMTSPVHSLESKQLTSPGYNYYGYYNQSLPSSPVSNDYNYYPSSSPMSVSNSSPVKFSQDSIWSQNNMNPVHPSQNQNQNPNIWSYTPNYQFTPNQSHGVNPPMQYLNSNFVGYTNPYYAFNMASC